MIEVGVGVLAGEDLAAQVGDRGQDVVRTDVDADDDRGVGAQLEPPGGAALLVVADRARVRQLAQQAERRRAPRCTSIVVDRVSPTARHGVARGEDAGLPRVREHGVEARTAHGGREARSVGTRVLTFHLSPCIMVHIELIRRVNLLTEPNESITDDGPTRGQRRGCDVPPIARRRLATGVLLGLVGSSLAACASDGRETIRFALAKPEAIPYMRDLVEEYNGSQDEVNVVLDTSGIEAVSAGFVRGDPPDIAPEQLQPGDGALHPALRHVGPLRHARPHRASGRT